MTRALLIVSVGGLISSLGCASPQAKGKLADRPALVVPAPPSRMIEPATEPPPPEPVAELPPAPSSVPPRTSRPPAPKPAADARAEAKPGEPKPGDPKPADPPPVEPPPPVSPAAQLRTPQTSDTSAAAKNVRTTIDAALGLLNTVNYSPLSNVRKKAYNDAKLCMQQAEDALKQGNLVYAQAMANKAETLAKELAGR